MSYSLKHISIRVPWHDTGWDGRVCAAPRLNGACLKLKRIAEDRNDDAEELVAGQSIKDLPQAKWPACVAERVGFMAPFEYTREAKHPYNRGPETSHGHFKPTALRHPPYSAPAVPFAWMLREAMEAMSEEHGLDVQAEREPDLGFKTQWIQEYLNQTALLDCFAGGLHERDELHLAPAPRTGLDVDVQGPAAGSFPPSPCSPTLRPNGARSPYRAASYRFEAYSFFT